MHSIRAIRFAVRTGFGMALLGLTLTGCSTDPDAGTIGEAGTIGDRQANRNAVTNPLGVQPSAKDVAAEKKTATPGGTTPAPESEPKS